MPISDSEKKLLLERLEKARIAKQKKAEEARAGKTTKKAPEPEPIPEPVIAPPVIVAASAPAPAPEERPPASAPIDIPAPPDLVAAARKKPKKVEIHESDSDSDIVLPPKKKKQVPKKETPYLKIKLYKEPQDKAAFQNLLSAVAGENDDDSQSESEEDAPLPPPQKKHYNIGPRVVKPVGATPRGGPASRTISKEEIEANELRKLALQIFG